MNAKPPRSARRLAAIALIAVALLASAATAAAGELRLTFRLTHTELSHGKSGTGPAEIARQSKDIVVGLGDGYVYELGSTNPAQFDLVHRRYRPIDDSLHTYVDAPLACVLAYREMELSSRIAMMAAIAAARPKGPSMGGMLDAESELGLLSPARKKSDPLPELETGEGATLWRFGPDTATVCAFSDTTLTPDQERMFERYLVYFCKLHPDVRAAVVARNRLPRRLLYRWSLLGTITTLELTLTGMTEVADATLAPPAGYRRLAAYDSSLTATIDSTRARRDQCRSTGANAYALLDYARNAAGQGRALDALLAATEYNLTTCVDPPAFDEPTRQQIRKDGRCRQFTDAVEKITKQKYADAQRAFEKIDTRGLEKAYLLDLERGTYLAALGQSRPALAAYQRALRVNSCLLGAWTDMGSIFGYHFDTVDHWICIDLARQMAPTPCPLLQRIDENERAMVQRHPEYF